jgi:hypothetical protein
VALPAAAHQQHRGEDDDKHRRSRHMPTLTVTR